MHISKELDQLREFYLTKIDETDGEKRWCDALVRVFGNPLTGSNEYEGKSKTPIAKRLQEYGSLYPGDHEFLHRGFKIAGIDTAGLKEVPVIADKHVAGKAPETPANIKAIVAKLGIRKQPTAQPINWETEAKANRAKLEMMKDELQAAETLLEHVVAELRKLRETQ